MILIEKVQKYLEELNMVNVLKQSHNIALSKCAIFAKKCLDSKIKVSCS